MRNAADAIEFYKLAFGAIELLRLVAPSGEVAHTEIKIGDSPIMLADEMPGKVMLKTALTQNTHL